MHRLVRTRPLCCLLLLAGCGGTSATSPTTPPVTPPPTGQQFAVTVTGGYGSGSYAVGDTVYGFAAFPATNAALSQWTGDAVAAQLTEWSGRFVMPARAVTLAVATTSVAAPLTVGSFAGTTTRAKSYRFVSPASPRGVILAFHGTGGSSRIIERGEGYAITLDAVAAGYAVVSYDSEETVAGDLDGNGKLRWNTAASVSNVDFANLDALIARLRSLGLIAPTLPLYAFGMSNGSSMVISLGAVATQPDLAAAFPNLRFRAIVGFCAPGSAAAAAATTTPTAWYICRNDTNDEVGTTGNQRSVQQSAALAARGVATDVAYNEPAPLYEERFTRAGSIDATTSRSAVQELRRAGYLDSRGFVNRAPEVIVADVQRLGAGTFPIFSGLSGLQQADAVDALRETYADHQLFADQSRRMLGFFGRF